ncbi:GDSL-type esterase/lipase family protein [Testudinibacter sp. P27/CKL/0425]
MALKEILQFVAPGQQVNAEAFLVNFSAQRRERMTARYNQLNALTKPHQIVLLGDSITEEFPINEMLPEIGIYNRGISGNDTYDVLSRLPQHIYPLQPTKLFLLIGVNDLAKYPQDTPQQVSERVAQILALLQQNLPDCQVHLLSVLPVNKSDAAKIDQVMMSLSDNQRIRALNQHLQAVAKQANVAYLDLHSHFLNAEQELKLEYTREGLHLTIEGYRHYLQLLMPHLQSA